ncbi:cytochrome P450 [Nocardia fluminea]|uniref:Cytochrome P450 n=1 Tax=Nocardia fluminea TaxID=134984 RepID=A0A2N3VK50_9NOCA|nr:cytochrome P450 [Nocardia fluminea]PKV81987.1 cytochrome P450 [Nocardia fluminea]
MSESTSEAVRGAIVADPVAWADPGQIEDVLAGLRREDPVSWVEIPGYNPFWLVTRHADVMAVERNAELFTSGERVLLQSADQDDARRNGPLKSLIDMDGAEHRTHRAVTNDWFKPGRIRSREEAVTAEARRTVDELIERGGECDFAEVIAQFPLRVVLSILGLPPEKSSWVQQMTQEVFGATDPDMRRGGDLGQSYRETMREVLTYFMGLTADRQKNPNDDLASVIANADIGEAERLSYYGLIATAGHDTTSYSITGGMAALLENPDQLALLRRDPEALTDAVEEMLRWSSPVRGFLRTAQRDTEVGGVPIKAGQSLLLSFLSANRDEAAFEEPTRFDITRARNRHVAFGFGPHACLGAHLARLEMKVFFTELLSRIDEIELAGEPAFAQAVIVSGIKRLPVRYKERQTA